MAESDDVIRSAPDNGQTAVVPCEDYNNLLAQYNAEFANRYTDSDPNFHAYLRKENEPPPIVDYFNSRPAYRGDDNRNYNRGYKRRYDDRPRQDHYRQDYHQHRQGHRSYDPRHDQGRRPQYNRPWQGDRPWKDNRSHDQHQGDQGQRHYGRDQKQRERQHQQAGGPRPHNEWT